MTYGLVNFTSCTDGNDLDDEIAIVVNENDFFMIQIIFQIWLAKRDISSN